jgi:SsrA-binding protein
MANVAKKKKLITSGNVAVNRPASFRYHLLDRFECGIVLLGTEVKSMREGGVQLKDGFVMMREGELWLMNVHIAPYASAYNGNHDPERSRKLLMHRREIDRLAGRIKERGLTIVPTRVYFSGPLAKVEIALARGKDLYDKREAIKERDTKRDVARAMREVGR